MGRASGNQDTLIEQPLHSFIIALELKIDSKLRKLGNNVFGVNTYFKENRYI